MSNEITTVAPKSLIVELGNRYGVEPDKLLNTLKNTCFKTKDVISNEQMMALLIVAKEYNLNPFTKEIYAFPDKGGIVPVVGVDGWMRLINSHPMLDGITIKYADELVTLVGAMPCPIWCEVTIHRKDQANQTTVREYLDECYRPPFKSKFDGGNPITGPWQTHTKRFLRHKALIQAARIAFGFAGIYDADEAERIKEQTRAQDRSENRKSASSLNDKYIIEAEVSPIIEQPIEATADDELADVIEEGELSDD